MLLWIHPVMQTLVALLALYVLALGLSRFASRHLNRKTTFQWKRHVLLGKIVVAAWALGGLGGLVITYLTYGRIYPQSLHFITAVIMFPVLLVTWVTGTRLDSRRSGTNALPLVHLVNNVLLLVLAGVQLASGLGIAKEVLFK